MNELSKYNPNHNLVRVESYQSSPHFLILSVPLSSFISLHLDCWKTFQAFQAMVGRLGITGSFGLPFRIRVLLPSPVCSPRFCCGPSLDSFAEQIKISKQKQKSIPQCKEGTLAYLRGRQRLASLYPTVLSLRGVCTSSLKSKDCERGNYYCNTILLYFQS